MSYINKNRLIITILIFSILFSCVFAYFDNAKLNISESVVRLHVIANSDTDFDQNIKLKVRDKILKEASEIFNTSNTPKEALEKASMERQRLCLAAKDVLKENGLDLDVKVETGSYLFPVKNYGDIMLPAGEYKALRVVIGEGKGKNWWCVMFPPLCLAKGTIGLTNDGDAYLKTHLSDSEYNLIKCSDNTEPIIRFKLLELLSKL